MLAAVQNIVGLWAYQKSQNLYHIHRQPFGPKADWLICDLLERLIPRCWEKGCKNYSEPYVLRGYDGEKDSIYWYCTEHSQRHGFCFACGEFWGGTESFDFGPGYCSNCAAEFEEDEDAHEDEWSYELQEG